MKRKQLIVDEEAVVAASSTDAIIDMPEDDVKPHSVKDLLSIPVLRAVFASSSALGFAGSAFNSGFVLMAYTPLEQGGLALSVRISPKQFLCAPGLTLDLTVALPDRPCTLRYGNSVDTAEALHACAAAQVRPAQRV